MRNGSIAALITGLVSGLGCVSSAMGAQPRHWVYLADKGFESAAHEAAAVAGLPLSADPRAVARRERRRSVPGLFDARDLPVAARYESAVAATGARVHQRSRWLNAVSVEATPEQLAAISALPGVTRVVPVRGGRVDRPQETTLTPGDFGSRDFYGASSAQLTQIGVPTVHSRGARGEGVVIGILDTGFVTTHTAFNAPGRPLDVIASYDFVRNDANVAIEPSDHPDQHRHGTWILGCIGAYWPDTLVGGAYNASFVLCKTEDYASETQVEEDNYVAGLEFAESFGADVCTSSLGYIDWYTQADLDGATAVTTIAVNIATANGVVCVTAAGNEGHDGNPATSSIIAPADALEVITCGAVDEFGNMAGFSSDGPTADGRVKPEVLARGVNTLTVSSRSNTDLGQVSGTSLSTPLVAAAVACIVGEHPCWTVGQIRTSLFGTASRGGVSDPVFVEGFGIINAAAVPGAATCPGDFNDDGFLDFFDYDAYVTCFETEVCPPCRSADHNRDGFADFFDYDDYVRDFEVGC
jgi:hypothetical protein